MEDFDVRQRLSSLHEIAGLSFREIAALDEFSPIPAGTLCAIYHGRVVPKKWRKHFGLTEYKPAPVCVWCGQVHTIDGVCIEKKMVSITVVEMTAEELSKLDKTYVIKVRVKSLHPKRRRVRIDLPASVDAETRALLHNMTPGERLEALMKGLKG